MTNAAQKRALRNYRSRLTERGLARFEVLGRDGDRALIRTLARRLSEEGPDAAQLRRTISEVVAEKSPAEAGPLRKGGIYAALRRSPLVGSGIELNKTRHPGRDVDL